MKTIFIKSNVTDQVLFDTCIQVTKDYLATIGVTLQSTQYVTDTVFTGSTYNYTDTAGNHITSTIVTPNELVRESAKYPSADNYCLVYDWTKVSPQPTVCADGGKYIQIPVQWYGEYPEVFAQFFLHEICHQYCVPDLTHNQFQNPDYRNKQSIEYYLYLLKTSSIPKLTSNTTPTTLKFGMKSKQVLDLQFNLKVLGYFNATPTAYFGVVTKQAVIDFQKANGLVSDGIAGPKTLQAILDAKKKL